jgi:hypothetical protein
VKLGKIFGGIFLNKERCKKNNETAFYNRHVSIFVILLFVVGSILPMIQLSDPVVANPGGGDLTVFEAEDYVWDNSQKVSDSDASGGWAIKADQTGSWVQFNYYIISQDFSFGWFKYYIRAKSSNEGAIQIGVCDSGLHPQSYQLTDDYRWYQTPMFENTNVANMKLWAHTFMSEGVVTTGTTEYIDKIILARFKNGAGSPTGLQMGQIVDPNDGQSDTDRDGLSDSTEKNNNVWWFETEHHKMFNTILVDKNDNSNSKAIKISTIAPPQAGIDMIIPSSFPSFTPGFEYQYYIRARMLGAYVDAGFVITDPAIISLTVFDGGNPVIQNDHHFLTGYYKWYSTPIFGGQLLTGNLNLFAKASIGRLGYPGPVGVEIDKIMIMRVADEFNSPTGINPGQISDPLDPDTDMDNLCDGNELHTTIGKNVFWFEAEHYTYGNGQILFDPQIDNDYETEASNSRAIKSVLPVTNGETVDTTKITPILTNNMNGHYKLFFRARKETPTQSIIVQVTIIEGINILVTEDYLLTDFYRWYQTPLFITQTGMISISIKDMSGLDDARIDKFMLCAIKDNLGNLNNNIILGQISDPLDADTDYDFAKDSIEVSPFVYWYEAEDHVFNINQIQNLISDASNSKAATKDTQGRIIDSTTFTRLHNPGTYQYHFRAKESYRNYNNLQPETENDINGIDWRPSGEFALGVGEEGAIVELTGDYCDVVVEGGDYFDYNDVMWRPQDDYALAVGTDGVAAKITYIEEIEEFLVDFLDTSVTYDLKGIGFNHDTENTYALISGEGGELLKFETSGGSYTFTPVDSGSTEDLEDVKFQDDNTAIIVGTSGTILDYEDEETITPISSGTTNDLNAVSFYISNTLIVGNDGKILGYDESQITDYSNEMWDLYGIDWKDDGSEALICGESGDLFRFDPSTTNVLNYPNVVDLNINDVGYDPDDDISVFSGDGGCAYSYEDTIVTVDIPELYPAFSDSFVLSPGNWYWYSTEPFTITMQQLIGMRLVVNANNPIIDKIFLIQIDDENVGHIADPLDPDVDWDLLYDGREIHDEVWWFEAEHYECVGANELFDHEASNAKAVARTGAGNIFTMNLNGLPNEEYYFYVKAKHYSYEPWDELKLELQYLTKTLSTSLIVTGDYRWYRSLTVKLTGSGTQTFTFTGKLVGSYGTIIVDKIMMIRGKDADGEISKLKRIWLSDPYIIDSDWDGLLDSEEIDGYITPSLVEYTTDALNVDTDFDRLRDGIEVGLPTSLNFRNIDQDMGATTTDPNYHDTDYDCLPDGWIDGYGYDLNKNMWGNYYKNHIMNLGTIISGKIYCEYEDANLNGVLDSGETDNLNDDSDNDDIYDGNELFFRNTDPLDDDTDDDGLMDGNEVWLYGTDPTDDDTDGDKLNDGLEKGKTSAEGSGTAGTWRADTDGTTETNPLDKDTDDDGLPDGWIDGWCYSTSQQKWGKYGSTNSNRDIGEYEDYNYDGAIDSGTWGSGGETDPEDPDSDYSPNTGINDGDETTQSTDPTNPSDDKSDWDGDGLYNGKEDFNGNGILDAGENYLTNPKVASWLPNYPYGGFDSDNDGLSDGVEVGAGSDPMNQHSDSDGIRDDKEKDWNKDTDGDGAINAMDTDSDDDGLDDDEEDENKDGVVDSSETDPTLVDTDGDQLSDYDEIYVYETDPIVQDMDSDTLSDGEEINNYHTNEKDADTDGDSLDDNVEISSTQTNANCSDTDQDGIEDSQDPRPNDADSDSDGDTDFDEDEDGDLISNGLELYVYDTKIDNDHTYTWMDVDRQQFLDSIRSNPMATEFMNDPYGKGDFIGTGTDYENCYIKQFHQRSPQGDGTSSVDWINKGAARYTANVYQTTTTFSITLESYNDNSFTKTPSQNDAGDEFGNFVLRNMNGDTYSLYANGAAITGNGRYASSVIITLDPSETITQDENYVFSWSNYFDDDAAGTYSTLLVKSSTANTKLVYLCPGGGSSTTAYKTRIYFENVNEAKKIYFEGYTKYNDYLTGPSNSNYIELDGTDCSAYTKTTSGEHIYQSSAFCHCLAWGGNTVTTGEHYIDFDWVMVDSNCHWQYHITSKAWDAYKYNENPNTNDYDGDGIKDYDEALYSGVYTQQTSVFGASFTGGGFADKWDIFIEIDCMNGHVPNNNVYEDLVQAFADAPIRNPDGTSGIILNIDDTGGQITHDDSTTNNEWNGDARSAGPPPSTTWSHIYGDYFTDSRQRVFWHYSSVHEYGGAGTNGEQQYDSIIIEDTTDDVGPRLMMHELGHAICAWEGSGPYHNPDKDASVMYHISGSATVIDYSPGEWNYIQIHHTLTRIQNPG